MPLCTTKVPPLILSVKGPLLLGIEAPGPTPTRENQDRAKDIEKSTEEEPEEVERRFFGACHAVVLARRMVARCCEIWAREKIISHFTPPIHPVRLRYSSSMQEVRPSYMLQLSRKWEGLTLLFSLDLVPKKKNEGYENVALDCSHF